MADAVWPWMVTGSGKPSAAGYHELPYKLRTIESTYRSKVEAGMVQHRRAYT